MSKGKQKKKLSQQKRKQMLQEVFKKGKKLGEIAKKFDEKIAQKQGSSKKSLNKFQQLKKKVCKLSRKDHLYHSLSYTNKFITYITASHSIQSEKSRGKLQ